MYDQTDLIKGRRMTEIPIASDNKNCDQSASKQAYFDRTKPILFDRAKEYLMELDQPLPGVVTTSRDN